MKPFCLFINAVLLGLSQQLWATPLTLTANVSNDFTVDGQWLVPFYCNNKFLLYTDLAGRYSDDSSWSNGLSLGFRHVMGAHYWGAYLFADYNHNAAKQRYWSLNPGLEYLGSQWDWHLNGYLPLGTREWLTKQDFADQFGDYQFTELKGHQQYNHRYNQYTEVAPGLDLSATWHTVQRNAAALTMGGYHFSFRQATALNGLYVRAEYPLNPYVNLLLTNSYDNHQDHQVSLGIKFNFGSRRSYSTALSTPVERSLATWHAGTLLPKAAYFTDLGGHYLERDHILFFHPGATPTFSDSSSCTAEHPCGSFQQTDLARLHEIMPETNIYLSHDNYAIQQLSLYSGQNVYGRSNDYRRPDPNTVLIGHINLNSDTALHEVQLINDPKQHYASAISINNANNVMLNHVTVGTRNPLTGYITAIDTENSRNITIANSSLFATDEPHAGELAEATGIYSRSSQLTLKQTSIIATASSGKGNARATAIVMLATDPELPSELIMQNSSIMATASSQLGSAGSQALDNQALSQRSQVEINNSTLSANASSQAGQAMATAIYNHSEEGMQSTFTLNHTALNAQSSGVNNQANAVGIVNTSELEANDNFAINDSIISTAATSVKGLAQATAISSNPAFSALGRFTITHSYLAANATSQTGEAKSWVIKSLPFYDGISQFVITDSTLESIARSQEGTAQATAIQAQTSQLAIEGNLIMSSAEAMLGKAQALGIEDLGGNDIVDKNNQFYILIP